MKRQSTVTSKGQVTIPREIREALSIRSGDVLEWQTTDEGGVSVRRRVVGQLEEMIGMLGTPPRRATVEDMDEAIAEHLRSEWGRR